jgi:hypothetical protein
LKLFHSKNKIGTENFPFQKNTFHSKKTLSVPKKNWKGKASRLTEA